MEEIIIHLKRMMFPLEIKTKTIQQFVDFPSKKDTGQEN
jgi:hypothetical protein